MHSEVSDSSLVSDIHYNQCELERVQQQSAVTYNWSSITARLHTKPPFTDYQPITKPSHMDWHTVLPPVPNFLLVFFQGPVNQFRGRKLNKSIARRATLAVLHDDYTIRCNRQPCHNQPPTNQHTQVSRHNVSSHTINQSINQSYTINKQY